MKKICAFIMIMMLGLSFGGQKVLAADIVTYGTACTCGGSLNQNRVSYDAWETYASTKCSKNNNLYDSKQKTTKHTTYKCNRCGYQVTIDTKVERTLCTH